MGMLSHEEGRKNKPYKDHLGYWTIGVGHLTDERKGGTLPDWALVELDNTGKLSNTSIDKLLEIDVNTVFNQLKRYLPWTESLDPVRYAVLVDMCFQMGIGNAEKKTGLLGFKNTLGMIERGNYHGAADGMLNSLWARQTPERAKRRSNEMKTGMYSQKY